MPGSDTSLTLLASLRDGSDQEAWHRFDRRYRPVLVRFAERVGLGVHEAEEVAQRTVVAFCETCREGTFDRAKGRFRSWLFGIARHKLADLRAEAGRFPTPVGSAAEALLGPEDVNGLAAVWEQEWERYVLETCFSRAKGQFTSRDIAVFEQLTLEQEAARTVAEAFGLSAEAVRQIRHRVLGFMREVREELEKAL